MALRGSKKRSLSVPDADDQDATRHARRVPCPGSAALVMPPADHLAPRGSGDPAPHNDNPPAALASDSVWCKSYMDHSGQLWLLMAIRHDLTHIHEEWVPSGAPGPRDTTSAATQTPDIYGFGLLAAPNVPTESQDEPRHLRAELTVEACINIQV